MKLKDYELWELIKTDLEKKGATVKWLEAVIGDNEIEYIIIINWPDGNQWRIKEINQIKE